eukprot:CFRG5385T1
MKLGIVHLGRAGGKHKYMLCDASDIPFVKRFRLSAKVVSDRNGIGCCVYVVAKSGRDHTEVGHFHRILWQHHYGHIQPDVYVNHKNKVTVDNRLCNLELSTLPELHDFDPDSFVPDYEGIGLYQAAIDQLPAIKDGSHGKRKDMSEEEVEEEFVECHWPPCCQLRFGGDGFLKCKRCGCTNYCGLKCRQMDWVNHKKHCRRSKKMRLLEIEERIER